LQPVWCADAPARPRRDSAVAHAGAARAHAHLLQRRARARVSGLRVARTVPLATDALGRARELLAQPARQRLTGTASLGRGVPAGAAAKRSKDLGAAGEPG